MNQRLRLVLCGFFAAALASAALLAASNWAMAQDTPAAETATETPAETPAATPAEAPKEETPAEATPPAASGEKTEEAAEAVDPGPPLNEANYALDNMMLFLAAVLVLFMQAGFSLVETGLNASKNAVNIMFKNFMDLVVGVILFYLIGYGLMYPGDSILASVGEWKILGFGQFGIAEETGAPTAANLHSQVDFLFQVAFCATAATIVSGAVAGRIKFSSYLIYTAIITGLIYPISGMWKWGGGWLNQMQFTDFAGSVVVHAVGGFAGLAGAIALGPRIGRFVNGKSMPMPGHNIPMAALGVFILWIGWYGFNPGSQLAFTGKVNTDAVMLIAVNTTLAAATGALAAMIMSWVLFKKPDLTMALNGALGGLVGITANCHAVSNPEALLIGAVAGVIVTLAVVALDKLQIDDPVGAFPVHGACGIWGGLATGLFGTDCSLMPQVIGTFAIAGWALGTSLVMFYGLKAAGLLRVDAEEELAGLDISEHGMYAYPPQLVVDTHGSLSATAPAVATSMAAHGKPSTEAV
jgi:Amt family ammonium transporter